MREIMNIQGLYRCAMIATLILIIVLFGGCDQEEVIFKSQANTHNSKGLELIEQGKAEEAITVLNQALSYVNEYKESNHKEKDKGLRRIQFDTLSNLSYAYYEAGDFEKSLYYADEAIGLQPNFEMGYVHKGKALECLFQPEEALINYKKALEINTDNLYTYYNIGRIYYDQGDYVTALEMLEKSIDLNRNTTDRDIILYFIWSLKNNSKYEEALLSADYYIHKDKERQRFIDGLDGDQINTNEEVEKRDEDYAFELDKVRAELIDILKGREEAITSYQDIATRFQARSDAQSLLGEYYYYQGLYQEALDYYLRFSEDNRFNFDDWIIYCYDSLGDYDKVLSYGKEAIKKSNATAELYNAIGYSFTNQAKYMESLEYLDKAIELDPEGVDPYINKLYALYYGKRYTRCTEFGKQILDLFPSNYDVPAYIAEGYYNLSEYNQAIRYYLKALEISPENDGLLSQIANAYYMKEDYQSAQTYANQCIQINSSNSNALYLLDLILERKEPVGKQMKDFIRDNYLYYSENTNIEEKTTALFPDQEISNADIEAALEQIRKPEDSFTFVIYDEMYDYLKTLETDTIKTIIKNESIYIRISGFYPNTDNNVIEVLDRVVDPNNKRLILDLCDNSGGLTYAANNILDVLLPSCVTSTIIDREGYTYQYYSDASALTFKEIYILVNENSASAAELLTLGLKTYLNNVTIVGTQTFGKGVGQTVFEDKDRRLMVYLVDSYWNVRQQNVMDSKIKPDIYVKSNKLEDYLKAIDNKEEN